MNLEGLAGNAALKQQLSAQERGRGLSHAYLISGPRGSGKRTLAQLLCAAMVCTGSGEKPCGVCPACKKAFKGIHPDVITVRGEDGKDISVAQARAIRADAYIRPNEASRKVYVFEDATSMDLRTQNVLLKLLEDGPVYAAFLLLCENPGGMLETIRSRCETLTLVPPAQDGNMDEKDDALIEPAQQLLELIRKRDELALAQWLISLEKWDRDTFAQFCEVEGELLRNTLVDQVRNQSGQIPQRVLLDTSALLKKLREDTRFNVGIGHLCGALAAGLAEIIAQV